MQKKADPIQPNKSVGAIITKTAFASKIVDTFNPLSENTGAKELHTIHTYVHRYMTCIFRFVS